MDEVLGADFTAFLELNGPVYLQKNQRVFVGKKWTFVECAIYCKRPIATSNR
jgi:hypothetical protein